MLCIAARIAFMIFLRVLQLLFITWQ